MTLRVLLMLVVSTVVVACTAVERVALPKSQVLENGAWSQAAKPPGQIVDHGQWSAFLNRYVDMDPDGVNRVAYAQVSKQDREALDRYLTALQKVQPAQLTRDQQLAYWINLYNALTVDVVLEDYPVDSIREITNSPLPVGPWSRSVARVAGQSLTLNDIEHRIIRPVFKEPRIHYALNCAAAGCPNLMARAWKAKTLEADLAAAEHGYVHDPRGVRFDAQGRLVVSRIYAWFREDFAETPEGVLDYLRSVADPELRSKLDATRRIARYDYDWSLNDQAQRAQ